MNSGVLIDLSPTTDLECLSRISVVTIFHYFQCNWDIVHWLLLRAWNVFHVFSLLQSFTIVSVLGIFYVGFYYRLGIYFTYFFCYNLFCFTIFSMFFISYYVGSCHLLRMGWNI